MQLIGMTDEQYQTILSEVAEIQYLIIANKGMATKTLVENVLMSRFSLERGDAHTFLNIAESQNIRDFRLRTTGIAWVAHRPAPTIEKYPQVMELI